MRFRGLLAAVVVLAALAGVLWWSQRHKPSGAAPGTPALPAILQVDARNITSLTLHDKGAAPIVLVPSSSAVWQITAPASFRADSTNVNQMVATLANLIPLRVVEDKASDLSRYGLSDPSLSVDVAEKNNRAAHLVLGDHTPTGSDVYAMVPGNPHIYTVNAWVYNTLGKGLNDLRNRHLIPVAAQDINTVEIDRAGQTIAIDRVESGWRIQKPAAYRTSNYAVDDLVQQIVTAAWDNQPPDASAAAAFAHGTPVATAKITTGTGATANTDVLTVRKARNDFYATSSAMTGTWKIDASLASALDRPVDTYRNKQLLDYGFTEPLNLQYRAGSTSLNLVRSNKDWFADGKKMDTASVTAFIAAIRGLAATNFVDSGFTSPDVSLTIVTLDGRVIEKLQFHKTAAGAIARREDGPGLYVLDAITMNNLYTAAAGVKPAPPEPARK
ncbi:MAG TPA: DUF4340 domain-containing protein [Acidobacteriaceae bacterium]|jgi:hypothetical protein|nr:DUF4340 domain-containing protein [Acidobacteriaceae bacterium]